MESRTVRAFTDDDINKIADAYHSWRGTDTSDGKPYADMPGFCAAVQTAAIADQGYVLSPGRYVGSAALEEDAEELGAKITRLSAIVRDGFKQREDLQASVLDAISGLAVTNE